MITNVTCSECGRGQNAPSSRAGQTVPCRFCGEGIPVPGSSAPRSAIGGWRNLEPGPSAESPQSFGAHSGEARRVHAEEVEEERSTREQSARVAHEAPSGTLGRLVSLFGAGSAGLPGEGVSYSESVYESSERTEYGPDGVVRTTRSESGRGPAGPYEARHESVRGPDGAYSESSHESGQRPPGAPEPGEAPVWDRAQKRSSGGTTVGSPVVGAPVTDSRQAREARAGRPIVSGPSSGKSQTPFDTFLPGLNSDSQTEKAASLAMVLAVAGWAFCFPISLIALYQVGQCKKHALAENRPVPQLATIATITAALNLAFMALTCLGNVSLN